MFWLFKLIMLQIYDEVISNREISWENVGNNLLNRELFGDFSPSLRKRRRESHIPLFPIVLRVDLLNKV